MASAGERGRSGAGSGAESDGSPSLVGDSAVVTKVAGWLDHPISSSSCLLGWCIATAMFVGLVAALGGPARNDTYQSVFSTWAIAHGQIACAFPSGYRLIAPFYPLLSGGVAAASRIGSSVPFPGSSAMGPQCDHAFLAINTWSLHAGALNRTADIAYVSWLFLLAGLIVALRAMGRGRCRWEPATLMIVAVLPPVWMCIEGTFHPEDLIAMGFLLAAVAYAKRDAWAVAGVLIALSYLSQQFAILVGVALLVIAPSTRKLAYVGGAVATAVVVAIPLLALTSGRAVHAIVLGTGNTGGVGGTVVWELNLHGGSLFVLSRVTPVVLAVLVAWWSVRRLGMSVLEPAPLLSIVAVSLGLRLVFEQQLFGYYFMALAVTLVVLDVARGRVRASLVAWLATLSMVYLLGSTALDLVGSPWQRLLDDLIPVGVIALAMVLIMRQVVRNDLSWMVALWVAMIAAALVTWNQTDVLGTPPAWFWQMVFVPLGLGLAAAPLLEEVRHQDVTRGSSSPGSSALRFSSPT
jgi:hypothetical protein